MLWAFGLLCRQSYYGATGEGIKLRTERAFFKVALFVQELPDDATHAPSDNQDRGVGFFTTSPMLFVECAEVRRAADCYPTGFHQRPTQPLVAKIQQRTVPDLAATALRGWNHSCIGTKLSRRAEPCNV